MLNVLACLTRSGTGAGLLAGRVLSDMPSGAGLKGTTNDTVAGTGGPEIRDDAKLL